MYSWYKYLLVCFYPPRVLEWESFSDCAFFLIVACLCLSKFYRRHYELISKLSVGLKAHLRNCLSEPKVYGDLVYKFKKLIGRNDFSFQLR